MIEGVILHIENSLPVLVDLEALPEPGDRMIRCTNVRTVDGKRPSFVHDRNGTFIFPLGVIRMMEAPGEGAVASGTAMDEAAASAAAAAAAEPDQDEEPDEDLLARIRSI